jgi:hypothetical protein
MERWVTQKHKQKEELWRVQWMTKRRKTKKRAPCAVKPDASRRCGLLRVRNDAGPACPRAIPQHRSRESPVPDAAYCSVRHPDVRCARCDSVAISPGRC